MVVVKESSEWVCIARRWRRRGRSSPNVDKSKGAFPRRRGYSLRFFLQDQTAIASVRLQVVTSRKYRPLSNSRFEEGIIVTALTPSTPGSPWMRKCFRYNLQVRTQPLYINTNLTYPEPKTISTLPLARLAAACFHTSGFPKQRACGLELSNSTSCEKYQRIVQPRGIAPQHGRLNYAAPGSCTTRPGCRSSLCV